MDSQIITELENQSALIESTLSKVDNVYTVLTVVAFTLLVFFFTYIILKWSQK